MNITLNNRPENFKVDNITISELLALKNFTFRMLVIKVNGKLIKKNEYSKAKVVNGDNVQILHMISGG
jgi:thiamine biosynthesis protein ThiS